MLRRILAAVMVVATCLGVSTRARATAVDGDAQSDDATPARVSYTAGAVSFWRPGGDDWAPAQLNTPLAAGDELYTGRDGNLELQVGGRAFVRAWGDTQLGLTNHDPDLLQFRVTAGHVALDLRALDPGDVIEVDTPAAAFTVDQPGYYRVDVTAERSAFSTRRSGRATIATAGGSAPAIVPGQGVIVENGTVRTVAAPDLDVWDRWNDARTDALVNAVSAQYVPSQVYGVSELDRYGTWRADATYGAVWVPAGVAAGWAPYSAGRWIWDPRFGWTWLDAAPWGWAPFHYGRWVSLGGLWAWAPGPIVVRPAYSPALVAFFGTPTVGVKVAGPSIGWVALGWGEPVVPWWGRAGFVGRPWWAGWGGPRVNEVTVHRNVTIVNAVVAVRSDHFGRGAVQDARIERPDVDRLRPVRGRLDVKPDAASFRGGTGHAQRPPADQISQRVMSTRPPAPRPEPPRARDDRRAAPAAGTTRVATPRPDVRRPNDPRVEAPRPQPPRVEPRRVDVPRAESPRVEAPHPEPPRVEPRRVDAPRVQAPRPETPRVEPRRPEPSRVEPSRVDVRRPEPPRAEAPRMETPRRAAAPGSARHQEATRPAFQHRADPATPGRPQPPAHDPGRARHER